MADWSKYPAHPFSLPMNADGGAMDMRNGDIVRYDIDGRICRLDEAMQDGDAFVTWEDGTYDTVKWNHLSGLGK
jgi:hypothetical protein